MSRKMGIMMTALLMMAWNPQLLNCRAAGPAKQGVILLHGLARTEASMSDMAARLESEGYFVLNTGYPSRTRNIEELAGTVIPEAIAACRAQEIKTIHFVTHSMGGILVRYYLKHHPLPELGRVVMLSPPNQGSEVVDKLGGLYFFKWLNGPAGGQLSTHPDSLPMRLGPVDFDLGVITGDRSVNLILSMIIPGPDDGKVSVKRAQVAGMRDFAVIHATHPFIMKNDEAIDQTIFYLKNGRFNRLSQTVF